MEASILLFIQEFIRNDIFTPIMVFITHLGDFGMIWIILTVIFLFFNKTRKIAYMMICALLLSLLINNGILKNSFLRIRPYETIEGLTRLIEAQSDFSFPSGHSASSFAGGARSVLRSPRALPGSVAPCSLSFGSPAPRRGLAGILCSQGDGIALWPLRAGGVWDSSLS